MPWLESRLNGKPIFEPGARVRHKNLGFVGHILHRDRGGLGTTFWKVQWEDANWPFADQTAVDPEDVLEVVNL